MDRRTVLAAAGVAFGTAVGGCLSESSDSVPGGGNEIPDSRTDSTRSPTTDPTTVEGVVLEEVVVRKAVTYESLMGSGGVLATDGRQYVVASVRADRELSNSAFAFETDADSWAPGLPETAGGINRSVAGLGSAPVDRNLGDGPSYLAFTVPSPLSAATPRIRYERAAGATWPLPPEEQERLAAPAPRFELDALTVPDTVSRGDTLSVSLTARNVADTDGRFLAALYWPTKLIADDDESHVVERQVAAGDETTASVDLETEYATGEPGPVTLSVRGHVTAERWIRVRE